ncbi:MAG: Rpn family recombination-promoting nuclease/putative transposase [Clostridiales bacterium]|jgi:hypothetical protein|nr:Rpn family recombination-promoting nuclease/putative transposase [Clostridiales bacterium]MDR2751881.1 Rpn family recombination-promoting nuclease/putative transposase [Clostridiales bacterium]
MDSGESGFLIEHKSTTLIDLISEKERLIEVANAVTGCGIDPKQTEVRHIRGTLYNPKIYDACFILKWYMAFFLQHQSRWDPNTAIKMLDNFRRGLNTVVLEREQDPESFTQFQLPAIIPLVFYNGRRRLTADQRRIKYSEGYAQVPDGISTNNTFRLVGGPPKQLDFEVIVIDLLDPSSEKLLEKSPTLRGYAELTRTIYEKMEEYGDDVELAVHNAFDDCISNGNPLSEFLAANRSEWESLAFEEFTTDLIIEAIQESLEACETIAEA